VNAADRPAPIGDRGGVSGDAGTIDFALRGEHIALDALLKATGLAPSGGLAKAMVADGRVQVDGQAEGRKTCKIRAGQVVSVAGVRVRVRVLAGPRTG
jgi:ribosome-associated protein